MYPTTLTYIISDIDKALAFEWIAEELDKTKFDLHFILLNKRPNCYLETWLKAQNISVYYVHYEGKKNFFSAFWKVRKILAQNKSKIVHCHLFDASLIGLLAAKSLGIRKRIFTRHHATFHHEYFPRAVYYDKFINHLATDIVAISKNVQNVLIEKEKVNPQKIHLIHHGFRLEIFENVTQNEIENLKDKYNLQNKNHIIGVIARWIHYKGIPYIISAFKRLLEIYPNAHLVLANAQGDYAHEIKKLLVDLPQTSYTEILFEKNLPALYKTFTLYVHTPINAEVEAFGQTYVEALAAGVPSVFTLSGVAREFIEDEKNALVVDFCNGQQIFEAMQRLLSDKNLQDKLITNGKESIKRLFPLHRYIELLEKLYVV
jgi:glycosyltransferase involved in cell wall biosynthesis